MGSNRPLEGIRVVEMSHMVMGPACGMILVQLGAEVIKVEPPKGDKTRDLRGMGTAFFPLFNRGKRSVVLDLELVEDRETMEKLLSTADVFVENFKDGMLEKSGLDAETLAAKFPSLIIAGHKGFLSGPYEHRPALDEVVQMMTGLAMMTGSKEKPLRVGSSSTDIMGGMFGVIGILTALLDRKRTGKGENIRVGLFESSLFTVAQHMVQFDMTGIPSTPMPERTHAWPVYDIFETADGEKIFVGVVTNGHWEAFCNTYGLEQFLNDERLRTATDRILARSWTIPIVAQKMILVKATDLTEKLDNLGIPFAHINAPEDLFNDPHVLRDGGLVESKNVDGISFRAPALPLEMGGENVVGALDVATLGADTMAVKEELGLLAVKGRA
ncbi:MAG: CoA transferase [Sneathiella sp.]|nr:CoA transferase [Sneathiella sp.]